MIPRRLTHTLTDTAGQTMTEYALILVLIFAVVLVAVPSLAATTLRLFNNVTSAF
jgi:Flp pilus assembly pilin Flp